MQKYMKTIVSNDKFKILEIDGKFILADAQTPTTGYYNSVEECKSLYHELSRSNADLSNPTQELVQEAFYLIDKEMADHTIDWEVALEVGNAGDEYYEAAKIILADFPMPRNVSGAYVDYHNNREDLWVANIQYRYGDNWELLAEKIIKEGY